MRRFGVIIACANLGVLLTVAWWIGWPEQSPSGGPVDAVLVDDFRTPTMSEGLSHASFRLAGEEAQAELRAILDRQTEELEKALHLWLLRRVVPQTGEPTGDQTTGQKSPR